MNVVINLARAAFAVAAFALLPAAAMAASDTMGPMVAVPSPGKIDRSGLTGCYAIQGTIYGPYRMSFCLNRGRSTYKVSGGGLSCNGTLDWYDQGGGSVSIDLYRTPCGRGQDWSGDGLTCRSGGLRPLINDLLGNGKPKIMVPVPVQQVTTLYCRYQPVAGGYWPTQVTAKRTS
ncbi:MAG TPA: hypothetical protein VHA70_01640 [Bauldia sp.]|nr:hypothetical protein [Bauldia sp.]